jgi:hypothetical protein
LSQIASSLEEDRFLVSYSFLRMLLLLAGGSIVNAVILAYYGFTVSVSSGLLTFGIDWRLFLLWIFIYPIFWSVVATYSLPVKLRFSPFDLSVASTALLPVLYEFFGQHNNWLPLTYLTGTLIITASFLQQFAVASIVGLGKAGGLPYHYDSFLLESKKVVDFSKVYDKEQYRDWLSLPNFRAVVKKDSNTPVRVILSSARYDDLGVFVIFSDYEKGLLVQIIAFEKGKYSIFKSKDAVFYAEQIKKIVQWELAATNPIPLVVEEEREAAEQYALRITRSITVLRELRTRDRIVLASGVGLLTLEYFLWVFNIITSTDSYAGYSILTAFGIIAELSYRRLKETRIWERIVRKSTSSEITGRDMRMEAVWKRLQEKSKREGESES